MWLYGLAGLGVGIVLSRLYGWLVEGRQVSNTDSSVRDARRLAPWLAGLTGVGFAGLWLRCGPTAQTLVTSAYFSVFLLILVIDVAHRWIPNLLLWPLTVFALGVSVLTGDPPLLRALLGGVVGFGWFFLMAIAYRGAMGAGDVKLAGLIGLATGFPNVLAALTVGIVIGGAAAAVLLISGRKSRKSYIPYAPFLVTGALIVLVFGTTFASRFGQLAGW